MPSGERRDEVARLMDAAVDGHDREFGHVAAQRSMLRFELPRSKWFDEHAHRPGPAGRGARGGFTPRNRGRRGG